MSVAAPAPRSLTAPPSPTRALTMRASGERALSAGAPQGRTLVPGAQYRPAPDPAAPSFDPATERLVRDRLRESASQLVASALVVPILEEFRSSQPQGGLFGVSQAESRFGPVLDAELADAMVRRGGFRIERDVEAAMLRRAGLAPEPRPTLSKPLPAGGILA